MHNVKWSINELMTMCVQEEERLFMEQRESAMPARRGKGKFSNKKKKRNGKIPPLTDMKKKSKCLFCKNKGHMKKECPKFRKWTEKKGIKSHLFVMTINIVDGF